MLPTVFASLAVTVIGGVGTTAGSLSFDGLGFKECVIKGNVSINTGERIYDVPGQKYYDMTRIDPKFGERWFYSEDEAKREGWRKSRI